MVSKPRLDIHLRDAPLLHAFAAWEHRKRLEYPCEPPGFDMAGGLDLL